MIASAVPRGLPLAQRWLGEAELGILYRKQDMPEAPPRIRLADLADRPFISMVHSGPLGELFSVEAARLGVAFNDVASARTFFVATGLVRAGVGLAVVDNFTASAVGDSALDFRPLRPPRGVRCLRHHIGEPAPVDANE